MEKKDKTWMQQQSGSRGGREGDGGTGRAGNEATPGVCSAAYFPGVFGGVDGGECNGRGSGSLESSQRFQRITAGCGCTQVAWKHQQSHCSVALALLAAGDNEPERPARANLYLVDAEQKEELALGAKANKDIGIGDFHDSMPEVDEMSSRDGFPHIYFTPVPFLLLPEYVSWWHHHQKGQSPDGT